MPEIDLYNMMTLNSTSFVAREKRQKRRHSPSHRPQPRPHPAQIHISIPILTAADINLSTPSRFAQRSTPMGNHQPRPRAIDPPLKPQPPRIARDHRFNLCSTHRSQNIAL
jgi:hypothetical protein